MILIDTNVFMYAAGSPHAHKEASRTLLERVARGDVEAAVDAQVLQEILHRYRSLRRWRDGRRVYDSVRRIVPAVLPIDEDVLDRARTLLDEQAVLSARDALHAACCLLRRAPLCSYDRDFDGINGLRRVEPGDLR